MYKKQQALDQSLRSTSSLDGAANQSKSVSLVLNQTVGGGAESTDHQKSPAKDASANETGTTNDSKKKKKDKKKNSNGGDKCDNCPSAKKECCSKKEKEAAGDGDQKKVKSKCGCVIS